MNTTDAQTLSDTIWRKETARRLIEAGMRLALNDLPVKPAGKGKATVAKLIRTNGASRAAETAPKYPAQK